MIARRLLLDIPHPQSEVWWVRWLLEFFFVFGQCSKGAGFVLISSRRTRNAYPAQYVLSRADRYAALQEQNVWNSV
jgi:hypothetical protein